MDVIGVIPARLKSTRLSRKLLRKILGKTILQWTWEQASKARLLDKLIIACDDTEIQSVATEFGAEVVFTSPDHNSGTDRIAEAVRDIDAKIVINIQADEPLVHPTMIDSLITAMLGDKNILMATIKTRITDEDDISNPNVVKVITDKDNFAVYFSRFAIPYARERNLDVVYFKHIGLYGYTKDFLYTFKNLPTSNLEQSEKLEQLRALEAGHKVKVVETNFDSLGVDTEQDLIRVEQILSQREIKK